MKFMIAADIHGSAYYCEKLLEAYRAEKADRLLLLGDIIHHGHETDLPKEYNPLKVVGMLNQIKNDILCVKGDCDSNIDQSMLEFPIMAEHCLLQIDDITVFATHGDNYNINNVKLKRGDVLLHGHTHVPACKYMGGKNEQGCDYLYINPGSVSLSKDNSVNGYMIYDNHEFVWKTFYGSTLMRVNVGIKKGDRNDLIRESKPFEGSERVNSLNFVVDEFKSLFSHSKHGMYKYKLSELARLEYVGDDLCNMLGYTRAEFQKKIGDIYTRAIAEEDWPIFLSFIEELGKKPNFLNCKYRMKHKDGRHVYVSDTMESVLTSEGIIVGYSSVTDVTEYMTQQMYLQEKANIDEHTLLPNKNCCERILQDNSIITTPTACLMFDINGLKQINDLKGHVVGDKLIKSFAHILQKTIGEEEFVGRFGGDEFIAILHNVEKSNVENLIEIINHEVQKFNLATKEFSISFAVGYEIAIPGEAVLLRELLNRADAKMYAFKKSQKAKIEQDRKSQ